MGTTFLMAFALMLVIEGVLPFLLPTLWRETFRRITEFTDGQIRFFGLSSMLVGLLILYFARYGREWPCATGSFRKTSRTSCRRRRSASSACARSCWSCFAFTATNW